MAASFSNISSHLKAICQYWHFPLFLPVCQYWHLTVLPVLAMGLPEPLTDECGDQVYGPPNGHHRDFCQYWHFPPLSFVFHGESPVRSAALVFWVFVDPVATVVLLSAATDQFPMGRRADRRV